MVREDAERIGGGHVVKGGSNMQEEEYEYTSGHCHLTLCHWSSYFSEAQYNNIFLNI